MPQKYWHSIVDLNGTKTHQSLQEWKHVEQQNAMEMQCVGAAKQAEEQWKKNREIILILMRSIYFLAKNRIPHSTTYKELIEFQVRNGDKLLEKYLTTSNAQYTSKSSARVLIEAFDIWFERKLMCRLQESPYFSILADECQDISTQEELSICVRWLVDRKQEEDFLMVLHVRSTDAGTITEALQSSLKQKQLDLRKLIGQGYGGAATFAGKISGVHKQIQTSSAHVIYIHCSCHRLHLTRR